jgi:hypothetical protein
MLNEHWFTSLTQARLVIADWQHDYDEVRPAATSVFHPRSSPPKTASASPA